MMPCTETAKMLMLTHIRSHRQHVGAQADVNAMNLHAREF